MSSPSEIKIFYTGATGYLGGSVLARLLKHPRAGTFKITALVRSEEKAAKLKNAAPVPIETVIGSYSDLSLLEKYASEADIVFEMADCDALEANKALLSGLKKHHDATGKVPIFIHTSGTGVLIDNALGKFKTEEIYSDLDISKIESLAPTQIHRPVDLAIVDADVQGYAYTYIVLPPTIYGVASGPFVDAGVQNPHSIQVPALVKLSLQRGAGAMVGDGKNIWDNVQIDDVADLYIILLDSIFANPTAAHGREGYYFTAAGEHNHYDLGKAISEALFEAGKAKSAEPVPFSEEELKAHPLLPYFGTNSRSKADRSRSIGWSPKYTEKDFFASVKSEVSALIKQ